MECEKSHQVSFIIRLFSLTAPSCLPECLLYLINISIIVIHKIFQEKNAFDALETTFCETFMPVMPPFN